MEKHVRWKRDPTLPLAVGQTADYALIVSLYMHTSACIVWMVPAKTRRKIFINISSPHRTRPVESSGPSASLLGTSCVSSSLCQRTVVRSQRKQIFPFTKTCTFAL